MRRKTLGIYEAKTNFSKLVHQATQGSEVVITNGGKPVAKIVGYSPQVAPRKPGLLAGKVVIKPGFDDLPAGFEEYVG